MTPISAIIFSTFGGLWVVFAILSQRTSEPILCLAPIGITALLIIWSVSVAHSQAPLVPGEKTRRNRVFLYATVFEAVAFFVGANILDNMAIADQYLPLLALIVGLHFLPFARFIPDRRYYPMSMTLVAIGTAGAFVASPDIRAWFVGLGCALVLWTASVIAIHTRSPSA